jgi:DNA-binding NarL/FixJ family response regulator
MTGLRVMEIQKTIRVILADDHPIVRRGIRRILEQAPDIFIVGEAGTGADTIALVRELDADVLLLDIEMPDIKGHQVARQLREDHSPIVILILSACDDDHFIGEILKGGVDGYIHKSETPEKIRQAVYRSLGRYAVLPAG